jgi:hypothetical protein
MSNNAAVDRFLKVLEADAKQYDALAANLEALLPNLDFGQAEWAKAEIGRRRALAKELRDLAELTKSEHAA